MAASAQIIDLGEIRRRRAQPAAASQAVPMPMQQPLPMAWVPVWFFMPMWLAGQQQVGAVAAASRTPA